MSYDWKAEASKEGTRNSPKLPDGRHNGVTVSKVVFGTKNGGHFQTKDGDRQIMVIVADNQEREAATMFTLNEKGGWALAKLCEACGLDLDRMTKSGITPDKFADEQFAKKNLEGRKLNIEVTNDGKYCNFTPLRPEGVQAQASDDFSNQAETEIELPT